MLRALCKKIEARGGDPLRETLTLLPLARTAIVITDEYGTAGAYIVLLENATLFSGGRFQYFL